MSVSWLYCTLIGVWVSTTLVRTQPRHDSQYHRPAKAQYSCYSCMSKLAEHHWPILSRFYKQPATFDDSCANPDGRSLIGTQPCGRVCLTLAFSLRVFGIPTDIIYVRGCGESISRHGFRNETMWWLDQRDTCRETSMAALFKQIPAQSDADVPLRVCSCLGERCNHLDGVNGTPLNAPLVTPLVPFFMLVLLWRLT